MHLSLYKGDRDEEIIDLFKQTFTDSEGESEGVVIGALVERILDSTAAKHKRVFITTRNKEVIGCVIFSKLRFEDSEVNIWLLSRAAIATSAQGMGLGQGLINFAHQHLKNEGVQQVVTYGDIKFYSKVGYQHVTTKDIPSPLDISYPEGWIAQSLVSKTITPITGKAYCVEALNQADLW